MIKISLFCGGRGSASLIREILRSPDVELNLLVNAYDNGMSTGMMRRFIPGYLGPSDFRKNLSYLLELHSPQQYILSRLLDYRISTSFDDDVVNSLLSLLRGSPDIGIIPRELTDLLLNLNGELKDRLYYYLLTFIEYYIQNKDKPFDFYDCSVGNLLFAGAYIKLNYDFEMATQELMNVFQSNVNAKLFNISDGTNMFLVALKEDGEFLENEEKIVGKQSRSKYAGIYLIPNEITSKELKNINEMDLPTKKEYLRELHCDVPLSVSVKKAIENSDIILYGPGTQHSSLFPSYMTKGLREVISSSKSKIKAFIININKDNDISAYTAEDLIDAALYYFNDNENNNLITHAIYNMKSISSEKGVTLRSSLPNNDYEYKGIKFIYGDYEHPYYSGIHSGVITVKALLDLYGVFKKDLLEGLDIYVDLNERSISVNIFIDEFLEIDWSKYVSIVRLYINNVEIPSVEHPSSIQIKSTRNEGFFSEIGFFYKWLHNGKSKYLATITGDGWYRLYEIINLINVLDDGNFGAVYGSRNQSRQQFLSSINAAYGESKVLYYISKLGALVISILSAFRFSLFSDPLTGFRVYNRRIINEVENISDQNIKIKTPLTLTKILYRNNIDIAELPVHYRTFKGFTNVKWRLIRGYKMFIDLLF
jgi:2-phospho-L-lactate transferase/gluconeogenesis factor (CofD/UPF0052 family)